MLLKESSTDTLDCRKDGRVGSKPETSLEANMTSLKPSCFWYIMRRQGSLEQTIMLGPIESSREGGGPNARWMDSIKETVGTRLQEPQHPAEDRALWTSLIHRVARVKLTACNTHDYKDSGKQGQYDRVTAQKLKVTECNICYYVTF